MPRDFAPILGSSTRAESTLDWPGRIGARLKLQNGQLDNPAKLDFWLGGQIHAHPDDHDASKSHILTGNAGTTFVNVSALTRCFVKDNAMSHSRLSTFTDGSDPVKTECEKNTYE